MEKASNYWWWRVDSNHLPADYERAVPSGAVPSRRRVSEDDAGWRRPIPSRFLHAAAAAALAACAPSREPAASPRPEPAELQQLDAGAPASAPLFAVRVYRLADAGDRMGMRCNGDEQLVGGGCACSDPAGRVVLSRAEGPPAKGCDPAVPFACAHQEHWACACDRPGVVVDAICLRGPAWTGLEWREQ